MPRCNWGDCASVLYRESFSFISSPGREHSISKTRSKAMLKDPDKRERRSLLTSQVAQQLLLPHQVRQLKLQNRQWQWEKKSWRDPVAGVHPYLL